MAAKKDDPTVSSARGEGSPGAHEARKIEDADDGVQSRFHAGYEDNPDKPNESSIAQVQVLKDED